MTTKNCYIGISKNEPLYCIPLYKNGSKWFVEYFIGSKSYKAFLLPNIDLEGFKGRVIRISILNSKYQIQIL